MDTVYFMKELFGLSTKQAVGIDICITVGVITIALIIAIYTGRKK